MINKNSPRYKIILSISGFLAFVGLVISMQTIGQLANSGSLNNVNVGKLLMSIVFFWLGAFGTIKAINVVEIKEMQYTKSIIGYLKQVILLTAISITIIVLWVLYTFI